MEPKSHKSFNGTFDLSTRQEFRERRRSVGVSLEQLGEFLKTHWSTIRKWEAGVTTTCHPRHVSRIVSFLDGEFDEEIRKMFGLNIVTMQNHSSHSHMIDEVSLTLPPSLKDTLIHELEKTFATTVTEYLDHFRQYDNKQ